MDGLLGGITGLCVDNFTEEFAKFKVRVEILGGDGEEGVALLAGGRVGCVGKRILLAIFKGDGLDCFVYFVKGCCCRGWRGFAGGEGGGLVVFCGFSFLLFIFGFLWC